MDEYRIGGKKRPGNCWKTRFFLKLNKIQIVRNIPLVKRILFKSFGFPTSTSINENFYCSSSLINVGHNVGLADTFILAYAQVNIGDNCSFSFRNMIITSTHDVNDFSTVIAKPVTIGKNVWVTSNVIILPGITIGDNSIIGAGSVVTKSIPSGVFAAGNPCKVIKTIDFRK